MVRSLRLTRSFFARSAVDVGPDLLGAELRVGPCSVVITEVEAYVESDPASHTFRGRTPRNSVMFGPPGRSYVYLCYGMHWCINVVTGQVGAGEAVLLRGGMATRGEAFMRARRPRATSLRSLSNGPGKLTAALGIDRRHNDLDLLSGAAPVRLIGSSMNRRVEWSATPRIGISAAQERPWRFVVNDPAAITGLTSDVPAG